uniref:putative single-stranded DNA binding protein n=1 Tax=Campylaephora boydenii TaxID=202204 RepID=UPI002551D3BF|nr:putative single-stranded DNA binding protein [Campylaephora boydenii]WGT74175.1 putative single-stranded DNA binding protein [Campylaephora boydenii]
MNLSIITVQIITKPRVINVNKKSIIYMNARVPNEKKNIPFYSIYVYSTMYTYDKFCELYQLKDIVILKGNMCIRQHTSDLLKSYYYLIMKIDDIQPYIAYLK